MSARMAAFEKELAAKKFVVQDGEWDSCPHALNPEWRCYYQSVSDCPGDCGNTCTQILAKHVPWEKNVGCESCITGGISSLLCGGFYSNLRIVKIVDGDEKYLEEDFGAEFLGLDPEARASGFCKYDDD